MMRNVVEQGTGTAAALEGVEVAGKTGTAEIDSRRHQRPVVHRLHRQASRSRAMRRAPDRRDSGGTVAAPIATRGPGGAGSGLMRASRATRSSTAATGCSSALGSGGMADVYCAEDQQLGRHVALKLLYRRFAEDAEFVERFRREASAAAGLQHPNIVGIYDRGEWDGTYYIAMEYLEGRTLKEIIRERGPAPPEAARRHRRCRSCAAARFAHRRGIVHRDIKPHNVIVDDEGRVKVTDFGIARAGASDMTETGSIMGTAQYLSPEQAQGQPVDAALGPVLDRHRALRAADRARAVRRRVAGRRSRSSRSPRRRCRRAQLDPDDPAGARGVVLRALEKDPARRFADADEFIAALAGRRRRAPPTDVVVVPRGRAGRGGRPPARRWWLWLLVAARARGDRRRRSIAAAQAASRSTVPNVIGRDVGDRCADPPERGLRGQHRHASRTPTSSATSVIGAGPAARAEAPTRARRSRSTVSAGPGSAAVPDVDGLPRDEAERAAGGRGLQAEGRARSSPTRSRRAS